MLSLASRKGRFPSPFFGPINFSHSLSISNGLGAWDSLVWFLQRGGGWGGVGGGGVGEGGGWGRGVGGVRWTLSALPVGESLRVTRTDLKITG